jgi:hypothetical protein
MKAVIVKAAGQLPVYGDFDSPVTLAGHRLINVNASSLSQITRAKASGSHYSSTGIFPFVAGLDGTGHLEDGQRVYFFGPKAPFGAMAERTLVPETNCVPLPDALDGSGHRDSGHVVLGGAHRARPVRARRDGSGQRRDGRLGTPCCPDREVSRSRKSHRNGS